MNDVTLSRDILHMAMDLERDARAAGARGTTRESICARAHDLVDQLTDLHDSIVDKMLDEEDAEDDVAQDWAELQYLLGLTAIAVGLPWDSGQRANLP